MSTLINIIVLFGVPALLILLPSLWLPVGVRAVFKKELSGYFNSLIAYIFLILFIVVSNLMFFYLLNGLFREESASMRRFFAMLPYVFVVFIPGLTMGAWAKEKNIGTRLNSSHQV